MNPHKFEPGYVHPLQLPANGPYCQKCGFPRDHSNHNATACIVCEKPTPMLVTQKCDECYELTWRVESAMQNKKQRAFIFEQAAKHLGETTMEAMGRGQQMLSKSLAFASQFLRKKVTLDDWEHG